MVWHVASLAFMHWNVFCLYVNAYSILLDTYIYIQIHSHGATQHTMMADQAAVTHMSYINVRTRHTWITNLPTCKHAEPWATIAMHAIMYIYMKNARTCRFFTSLLCRLWGGPLHFLYMNINICCGTTRVLLKKSFTPSNLLLPSYSPASSLSFLFSSNKNA